MPEIAEAYNISKKLEISKITELDIINPKIIKNDISWIKGSSVIEISNLGKAILFKLQKTNETKYLLSQLGMTGSWFNNFSRREDKHNQLILIQSKHIKIIYSDIRKFGSIKLYDYYDDILKDKKWLINTDSLSYNVLFKTYSNIKSNKLIKDLLLNQKYFMGIGNYLASEILFEAKISPFKIWNQVSKKELKLLCKSIKKIIKKSKKHGGFSFYGGYILPDGSLGDYKDFALVYRKSHCPACKNKISKEYINNRATYFCEKCQF